MDLRERTKEFAMRVVRMYSALPKSAEAQVLGKQVLRSGTSVGANYRKSSYWFELLEETGVAAASVILEPLQRNAMSFWPYSPRLRKSVRQRKTKVKG